jgi:diacylglycerol kinase family enzyme
MADGRRRAGPDGNHPEWMMQAAAFPGDDGAYGGRPRLGRRRDRPDMTTRDRSPGWRPRALALASLGCGVLLVLALVVFVARNLGDLVLALVGLAVAVAGAWWMVTEHMPRRAVGAVGAVIGVVVMAVAVIGAAGDAERPIVPLVVLGLLLVTTVGLARAALVQDLHERDRRRPGPVPRPQHPVLLCNPWSGGGKVEKFGLVALAEELGVEVMMLDRGLDLEQLARDAVARGADCLGMAGGDGSQALVASIAVEHGLPFVCVSAGTRNHFALDLGIDRDDPRACLYAYRDAIERRIDYATVGDRLFVNNVSLGIYATIVQQEGYREAKAETTKALLPEMLGRTEQPFDLQFTEPDGAEVDGAFLIQVSNNPYVLGATLDASQRRRLDTGVLGVVAVTGATGRDAAQVVALSALGQRRRSRNWHEFTTERFEVRSRSGKAYAGIDGEALELETPLEFRIHQRGLRLLVREGNVTAAERRRARDVAVGDLFALARGRDPLASGQR